MPPKTKPKRLFDLTISKPSGDVLIQGIEGNRIDTDDGGRIKFMHPETNKKTIIWGYPFELIEADGIGTSPVTDD